MDAYEKDQIEKIVRRTVESSGFEVFRFAIRPDRTLAIVLDRDPEPVTLNDCVYMNRRLRRALEQSGVDADDYSIDVESPGVDRQLVTLRHFERFKGQRVRLVLHEARGGSVHFKGTIQGVHSGRIIVSADDADELELELADVKSARLVPELPF